MLLSPFCLRSPSCVCLSPRPPSSESAWLLEGPACRQIPAPELVAAPHSTHDAQLSACLPACTGGCQATQVTLVSYRVSDIDLSPPLPCPCIRGRGMAGSVGPMQSGWWAAGSCMHGTAPSALPTHHRVRPKALARFFLTPRYTPSVVPPVPSLPPSPPALFANSVGCRSFYRPSSERICGLTFHDRIDPRDNPRTASSKFYWPLREPVSSVGYITFIVIVTAQRHSRDTWSCGLCSLAASPAISPKQG